MKSLNCFVIGIMILSMCFSGCSSTDSRTYGSVYLVSEQEFCEVAKDGNYQLDIPLVDEGFASLLSDDYSMREVMLRDSSPSRDSADYSFTVSYCTFNSSGEAKRAYNEGIWNCEEDYVYKQYWSSEAPYVEYVNENKGYDTKNYQGSNYSMHELKYSSGGVAKYCTYYCVGNCIIFMSVHGESNLGEASRVLNRVLGLYGDFVE